MGKRSSAGRARTIILGGMRIILLAALVFGSIQDRSLVMLMGAVGLFVTFIPNILIRVFKVDLPAGMDVITLLFIYGLLYFGKIRGWYIDFFVLQILFGIFSGIIFGAAALSVLSVLYYEERIKAHPLVIASMAFCFALAIGVVWELFEFALQSTVGFRLQQGGLSETMADLFFILIGGGITCLVGYQYIRAGRPFLMSAVVSERVRKHAHLFEAERSSAQSKEHAMRIIKEGENKRVEFKSTLRTNLHTNQIDPAIEHATLKTIVAHLNSDGGTILVGVNNNGEVVGVDTNFPNADKLGLHLTNLIKQHIGAELLPFIDQEVLDLDGKTVLKIECKKSPKEVFLKHGKEEQFYVRNGPASMSLQGKALVDYIENRFRS